MWDLLYDVAGEGRTILVTTHYVEEAERCQTIGFIHGGRLIQTGSPEECRRGLVETVLALEATPIVAAAAIVRRLEGVAGVSTYGNALRVFSKEADRVAERLRRALPAEGVEVRRVEPVAPTLEDVFMALTRDADGERG
jgi:ABC-2 type transport system ATP-binding protein